MQMAIFTYIYVRRGHRTVPQWDKANIFTCASFFIWLKLTRTRSSFMLSPYHHGDVSFLTQSQPRQQLLSHLNCQSRKEVRPKRGTEQHINPMGSYSLCAILELYGASSSPFLLLSYYCCLRLRRRLCSWPNKVGFPQKPPRSFLL